MATRQPTEIKVYWDEQDPQNPGWAQRVLYDDGHEEGGPYDGPNDAADGHELAAAVCEVAWSEGIEIDEDTVHVEPHVDGGFAAWYAD